MLRLFVCLFVLVVFLPKEKCLYNFYVNKNMHNNKRESDKSVEFFLKCSNVRTQNSLKTKN